MTDTDTDTAALRALNKAIRDLRSAKAEFQRTGSRSDRRVYRDAVDAAYRAHRVAESLLR